MGGDPVGVAALLAELVVACHAPATTKWSQPFDALLFGRHSTKLGGLQAELVDAAYDLRCVVGESRSAETLEACGARLLALGGAGVSTLRCLLALRAVTPKDTLDDGVSIVRSSERVDSGCPGFQHFSATLFAAQPRTLPAAGGELAQLMSLLGQPPRFQVGGAGSNRSPLPQMLSVPAVSPIAQTASSQAPPSGALQLEHSRVVRRSICWETASLRSIRLHDSLPLSRCEHQSSNPVSQASCLHSKRMGSPTLSFTAEGAAAFTQACKAHDLQCGHLDQRAGSIAGVSLDQLDLVRVCTAVLQGFRSSLFEFNEAQRRFTWNGERIDPPSMCSRTALSVAVQQVADAGTCCARIEHLARTMGDEEHARGLVRRHLGRTLGAYLQHVRAWLGGERHAGTSAPATLTSLLRRTRGLRAQLSQVCTLCGWSIEAETPSLSHGVQLLNRLYDAARDCEACPQHNSTSVPTRWSQVVTVFFNEAAKPFLRFAETWLQHGVIEDPFDEFAQQTLVDEAEAMLDLAQPHSVSPAFLTLQAWNQLLRCGATVRLVHRYDPSHYICQSPAPSLSIVADLNTDTYDGPDELSDATNTWSWMQFCDDRRRIWVDMLQAAAEKRKLQKEKELASQSPETVSEIARAVRGAAADAATANVAIAEHSRQQRLLYAEELRQQIEAERRRADTAAEEENMPNNDSVFSETVPEDVHMVAQIIEQEYAAKISLVEARMARLSWQQRRMQLQQARLQFWRHEAEFERQLLIVHSQSSLDPDSASGQVRDRQNLPQKPEEAGEAVQAEGAVQAEETAYADSADGQPSSTADSTPPQMSTALAQIEGSESRSAEASQNVDSPDSSNLETQSGDATVAGLRTHAHHGPSPAEGSDTIETNAEAAAESRGSEAAVNYTNSVQELKSVMLVKDVDRVELQPNIGRTNGVSCSVWSSSSLPPNVPLELMLRRCVQATIEQQDLQAQSAAVRIFLSRTELDLLQHLRNLRDYCLTGSPDFATALSSSIFNGIQSASREWVTTQNCTAALSSAFAAADTGDHVAPLFKLTVTGKRPVQVAHGDHDLDALDGCGLQMVYAPANSWPLDSVFDSKSMEDYNALWRLLMQLHRMLDAGRMLWLLLKDMTRVHGQFTVGQMNSLSLIRHDVQHFINVLQDHLKTQVLHVQWVRLERDLGDAQQVGKIQAVHRCYLDRLLAGCLLRPSSAGLLKVITSMFDLVLTFCAQLEAAERCHRSSNDEVTATRSFQEMSRTGQLFRKHKEFLGRLLRKQVEAAPVPALRMQAEELLRRLV